MIRCYATVLHHFLKVAKIEGEGTPELFAMANGRPFLTLLHYNNAMTILHWILFYAIPAIAAVYGKDRWPKQKDRLLVVHALLLLSILLMSVAGTRLLWGFQTWDVFALLAAVLLSVYLIGPKVASSYAVSSAIQEICILLAAMLLIPAAGILTGAAATSLMYTWAHRSHPSETYRWRWKYPVLFIYGTVSILLYTWLHQPLFNIALHITAGTIMFYNGFLLTQTKITPLRRNK